MGILYEGYFQRNICIQRTTNCSECLHLLSIEDFVQNMVDNISPNVHNLLAHNN